MTAFRLINEALAVRDADKTASFRFTFSQCRFLQQNAVVLLGGLARLLERDDRPIRFQLDTLTKEVRRNLECNGFLAAFGGAVATRANTVRYCEHGAATKEGVIAYLRSEWLTRGWVNLSAALADAVAGNIWEIYTNAAEHAESPVGVFSCGQYYPKMREVRLTIADFGIGIPNSVRRFVGKAVSADRALKWAFEAGTTTKQSSEVARGLGLATVTDLVRVNKGGLEVYSNDGYFAIDHRGERFKTTSANFNGTVFTVKLRCDKLLYCFASESGRRRGSR